MYTPVLFLVFSNLICCIFAGTGCITTIDFYGGTGGVSNAGSDSWFQYELHYKTDSKQVYSVELYNLEGNDMQKDKGDFWSLAGPEQCVTIDNVLEIGTNYIAPLSGGNGWYIQDAITYGELDGDNQDLILITHNYAVDSWADTSLIPPEDTVALPTHYIERDNCAAKDQCIKNIYVMGHTADDYNSGSNDIPKFQLGSYTFQLPDLPGNDLDKHRSDLWKVTASEAGISGCLKFGDVDTAAFHATGGDAWKIKDAIVTVQLQESENYAIIAGNKDFNTWIDKGETVYLTLRNACSQQQQAGIWPWVWWWLRRLG